MLEFLIITGTIDATRRHQSIEAIEASPPIAAFRRPFLPAAHHLLALQQISSCPPISDFWTLLGHLSFPRVNSTCAPFTSFFCCIPLREHRHLIQDQVCLMNIPSEHVPAQNFPVHFYAKPPGSILYFRQNHSTSKHYPQLPRRRPFRCDTSSTNHVQHCTMRTSEQGQPWFDAERGSQVLAKHLTLLLPLNRHHSGPRPPVDASRSQSTPPPPISTSLCHQLGVFHHHVGRTWAHEASGVPPLRTRIGNTKAGLFPKF